MERGGNSRFQLYRGGRKMSTATVRVSGNVVVSSQDLMGARFIQECTQTFDGVGLDERALRELLAPERGFQAKFLKLLKESIMLPQQIDSDRVESTYGYPLDYCHKSSSEQVRVLQALIPGAWDVDPLLLGDIALPMDSEGMFGFMRWQSIASTYHEALQKLFDLLRQVYGGKFVVSERFVNTSRHLRRHAPTTHSLQALYDRQVCGLLLTPAHFGLRHRGRSIQRTREVMGEKEFGLGIFEVGCMLLTHPRRLLVHEDLWIDCCGDEYSPMGDGQFTHGPCFRASEGTLSLDVGPISSKSQSYGSATAYEMEVA